MQINFILIYETVLSHIEHNRFIQNMCRLYVKSTEQKTLFVVLTHLQIWTDGPAESLLV